MLAVIGRTVLRELEAADVRHALAELAKTRSTRTIRDTRAGLVRTITYAQASGNVSRNVASFVKPPKGQAPGRPSRSLTLEQALAVLKAAEESRLHAYVVLSLLTGVRTEEARALQWDHVDLDGEPPTVAVWRSVRASGDVKTRRSRRTLALPRTAVAALEKQQDRQELDKKLAGPGWQEHGLDDQFPRGVILRSRLVGGDGCPGSALQPNAEPGGSRGRRPGHPRHRTLRPHR